MGCRLERSRQWAIRCVHEKQMHEEASFLNITYNDKHLPYGNTLDHEDIQKFLKRLRQHVRRNLPQSKIPPRGRVSADKTPPRADNNFKKNLKKIKINYLRYYMCGEYGDKTQRAHYHMCLYGWEPKDRKFYTTSGSKIKSRIYTSETLDKIWGKGNIWTGEVTFESAAYVSRYIMKKINGQRQKHHYESIEPETGEIINRKPEYTEMSLKPGIGAKWLQKYQSDVYPDGTTLARGTKSKSPKYYDKQYKKIAPLEYEDLLWKREQEGIKNLWDNTKERLAVKETVTKARLQFLKRNAH